MGVLREFLGSLGGDHRMLGQLQDGVTIAQYKNIPDDLLESFYALGYGHYQSGNLQEAHNIFLYISFHNHTSPKYLAAFGACCAQMGKLEQAEQALKLAYDINPQDPGPALNLAQVQESMGQVVTAHNTLLEACPLIQNNTAYKPLQQVANAMLERLDSNMIEKGE